MTNSPKILALAGSLRRDSYNKKLINIAAQGARESGATVTVIDLKDYTLPLFDQDIEAIEGMPVNAQKLKKLFVEHRGWLIASPEYNNAITPILKNALDWISRSGPHEGSALAYKGKVAALISTSPGALGGLRGLVHLRALLGNIGVMVLPDQVAIPKAHDAFNAEGSLKDAKQQASLLELGKKLVENIKNLGV